MSELKYETKNPLDGHAPLPWSKGKHPDNNGILYLLDANDEEIAVFYNTATDNQENINFIIHACNSHAAIAKAEGKK